MLAQADGGGDGGVALFIFIIAGVLLWFAHKHTKKQQTQQTRVDPKNEYRRRKDAERKEREDKERESVEVSRRIAHELLERNSGLIDQFSQIAERKISTLDEYGDENWEPLDREIFRCIDKIATAEGGWAKRREAKKGYRVGGGLSGLYWGPEVFVERAQQYNCHALYGEMFSRLEELFRSYHAEHARAEFAVDKIAGMTGVEFENHLMRTLKHHGCTVSGTPKTGDKGADIIARLSGRIIVIQAKRSMGPVGNKAVQEVAAARPYYGGTEAWVITNSTFTEAARELAQKNHIRLVCGADLPHIAKLLETTA